MSLGIRTWSLLAKTLFSSEPTLGEGKLRPGGGQAGLGTDGRQRLEALTFWSRVNTLVMGLLRIAIALYSAVSEGPRALTQASGYQTPSPTPETTGLPLRDTQANLLPSFWQMSDLLPRAREQRLQSSEDKIQILPEVS